LKHTRGVLFSFLASTASFMHRDPSKLHCLISKMLLWTIFGAAIAGNTSQFARLHVSFERKNLKLNLLRASMLLGVCKHMQFNV